MMEAILRQIVDEYRDLVTAVDTLDLSQEEGVARMKAKLRLFDGSILQVRQIWLKGRIEAYSYYWLRSDGAMITGWDNAPHHIEISTFPHHRHTERGIEASQETNLTEVLQFIRRFLG